MKSKLHGWTGDCVEMVNYNQMMIIMCVAQYEINLQLWFQKLKHSAQTVI